MYMSLVIALHTLTGIAIVSSGAIALLFSKGSSQHRLAGQIFASLMLMMGPIVVAGAWLAPGSVSTLGILFVIFIAYLVVSAWSTIRRTDHPLVPLDIAAPVVALCISIACLYMGLHALSTSNIGEDLPPREAYFFFAALAFVTMLLDINNIRQGGVRGKHRIVRHVWRMNCALFFATSSIFTGPGAIVFSDSVRGNSVLLIPQLSVVTVALFWIYRLLISKRQFLSKVGSSALESKIS